MPDDRQPDEVREPSAVYVARPQEAPGTRQDLDELEEIIFAAHEELGLRLELVAGLPIWETAPTYRHQRAIDRIRATISKPYESSRCDCAHLADVLLRFPDGSYKAPDISIFCAEPNLVDEDEDHALSIIPEAVVEIISKKFARKDLEIGPPFYLSQGVKDVIVFDPRTLDVYHFRQSGPKEYRSPVAITLECGCVCTV